MNKTITRLVLTPGMLEEFKEYSRERIARQPLDRMINYMPDSVIERGFQFFVTRKMTVTTSGASWYYYAGEKTEMGISITPHYKPDELLEWSLFHELWCKIEWIARYPGSAESIGKKNRNYIIGGE